MKSVRIILTSVGFLWFASLATTAEKEWFNLTTQPGEARSGRECKVVADRRVFAVMSFINAVGYDDESTRATMHPARKHVRERIAENLRTHSKKLEIWRELYRQFGFSGSDYIEWAVTLNADYPFKKVGPDTVNFHREVPKRLQNFPEILNEFWRLARLEEVWESARPFYLAELQKYDIARMSSDLDAIWRYVRMPRREARTMVSIPNLLDRHYNACSIPCGRYFVSIEGPGSHDYGLNIHEYLHEIVNPIVRENFGSNERRLRRQYEKWRQHPSSQGYDAPVNYVQECFVRALDAHIVSFLYPERRDRKRGEIERSIRDGFELTQFFHSRLGEFEQGKDPFDRFAAALLLQVPEPT